MSAVDILQELNAGYIRSVQAGDVGWFRRHLAGDFVNSNPDGSIVDRAGFLDQVARPVQIRDLRCDDVRIRVLGEVAIIHARTLYSRPDGTAAAGRYTDVWALRGDEWLCVCADVTRG